MSDFLFLLYFDTNYLLKSAYQFSWATYSIVISVALAQGVILGEAIIERFPRLIHNARLASILLLSLFIIHASVSVLKFADPEKIIISEIFNATNYELGSIILRVVGLNAGAVSIIAFSMTVAVIILFRFIALQEYRRSFIFIISIIMIMITASIRISDYTPANFEIFLYVLYQAGVTGGIMWGARRKLYSRDLRFRYFVKRWTGN